MEPQQTNTAPSQPPISPVPPIVPQVPQQPQVKNSLVVIMSILLMVSVAIAGLFYYQNQRLANQLSKNQTQTTPAPSATTDPTANWKTYTNTKVGFELKYPDRYPQPALPSGLAGSPIIYANGLEDGTDIIFGESSTDSADLVVFPFSGTVDELKNYTRSPITLPSDENAAQIKSIQVGEATALWYEGSFIRIYFVGKNHGFILNTASNHNKEEINQILSTFKFTGTQTVDTTNWGIYSNTSGKYSFKYPQNSKVNENSIVGVDGVSSPAPNTTQILTPVIEGTNGNISVTVDYKNAVSDLQTFISSNSSCSAIIPANGTTYKVDTTNGLIFKDTPCGPRGGTYLYFLHNNIGYIVTIESTIDKETTQLYSDQILATFKFTQ